MRRDRRGEIVEALHDEAKSGRGRGGNEGVDTKSGGMVTEWRATRS